MVRFPVLYAERHTRVGRVEFSMLPHGKENCNPPHFNPLSLLFSLTSLVEKADEIPFGSSIYLVRGGSKVALITDTSLTRCRHEEELRRLTARIREQEARIHELESQCLNLSLKPEWAEDASAEGAGMVASGMEREAALTGQVQRLAAVNVGSPPYNTHTLDPRAPVSKMEHN